MPHADAMRTLRRWQPRLTLAAISNELEGFAAPPCLYARRRGVVPHTVERRETVEVLFTLPPSPEFGGASAHYRCYERPSMEKDQALLKKYGLNAVACADHGIGRIIITRVRRAGSNVRPEVCHQPAAACCPRIARAEDHGQIKRVGPKSTSPSCWHRQRAGMPSQQPQLASQPDRQIVDGAPSRVGGATGAGGHAAARLETTKPPGSAEERAPALKARLRTRGLAPP
jgi:hypothetical protein